MKKSGVVYISKPLRESMSLLEEYCNKEPEDVCGEWICDNFYLIRQTDLELKRAGKSLPGRSVEAAWALLDAAELQLQKSSVEALFQVYAIEGGLTDKEMRALPNAFLFCLIVNLSRLVRGGGGSAKEPICSLRFVREFDFAELVVGYSPLERGLRCDPSGVYPKMDRESQNHYRKKLYEYAHKNKITPQKAVDSLVAEAKKKECGLGELLIRDKKVLWIKPLAVILFSSLVLAAFGFLFQNRHPFLSVIGLLACVPPIVRCTELIVQYLAGVFVEQKPILKLKLDSCPKEAKTCVAITGMFTSAKDVQSLYDRVERFFLSQFPGGKGDPNVYFGVIADLSVSRKPKLAEDTVIYEQVRFCCDRLNQQYGRGFFGYLRDREFSPTENSFCGKERKRGAILEFAGEAIAHPWSRRWIGDRMDGGGVRYLITLDSDTSIGFRQIYSLIGAMLHPLNRPSVVRRNGVSVVGKGYGILQPAVGVTLEGASQSPLSVLISGAGGREPYHAGAFDFFQDCFGVGMFCGKGIIDLPTYVEVCGQAFPDGIVLSHDILEGARLRCGYLRDEQFTDGVPSDTMSLWARRHRWIRGDVQALTFAGKTVTDSRGNRKKNPVEWIYRFVLFDNVLSDLLPFHLLLCILLSVFVNGAMGWRLCAVAVSPLLLPPILSLLGALVGREWGKFSRRYFSRVVGGVWSSILHFFHQCASLVTDGVLALDAAIRSIWRMKISRQKLLEWTTFSGFKGSSGWWAHIRRNLWSLVLGAVLVVLGGDRPARLFAVLWLIYPLISFWISVPYPSGHQPTERVVKRVRMYLKDAFSFFEANVNQNGNFLPPDNLSLSPCESVAYRCSPTNIGMYLLSVLAARDEQLITTAQMNKRIAQTISSVERLEKYKGNLYNWYDTTTGRVLGKRYVSTVDSGNLVVSLLALVNGLREYHYEDHSLSYLINRIETLINSTCFDFLYDSKKRLFYIGFDCESGKADANHYDMYMSEARMTSFYCVAKGIVPPAHWQALRRTLVESRSYFGAASWTGTCFEYFMPTLLLPVMKNGFESESLSFACREQQNFMCGAKKVFGVSESGYFAFDSDMNYQYRAFGVPSLRLKRETENTLVISPYSSFLMLRENASAMLANLSRLRRYGMYGKHGFYEALDCDPGRTGGSAIVKSYMTHHVGMSIVAASNFLHSDRFVKRFCADPAISAATVLLEEKIPVDSLVLNQRMTNSQRGEKAISERRHTDRRIKGNDQLFLYPGKECSLFVSSGGDNRLVYYSRGQHWVFDRPLGVAACNGVTIRVALGDVVFSNRKKENPQGSIYSVYCYDDSFDYCIQYRKIFVRIRFRLSGDSHSSLGITVSIAGYNGMAKASAECRPVLTEKNRYFAHPAFSDLFLQLYPSQREQALMLVRRPRGEEEESCAFLGFSQESHMENTFCFGEPSEFKKENTFRSGQDPIAMLYSHLMLSQRKMIRTHSSSPAFAFCVAVGTGREKIRNAFVKSLAELSENQKKNKAQSFHSLYTPYTDEDVRKIENSIFKKCFYFDLAKLKSEGSPRELSELWSYGISGDYPILCVEFASVNKASLARLLQRKRVHYLCGACYDLVILVNNGGYRREEFDSFGRKVFESKTGFLLGKKGGIHPIDCTEENRQFFRDAADLYWDEQLPRIPSFPKYSPEPTVTDEEFSDGVFCPEGFLIRRKSLDNPPWSHILSSKTAGTLVTDRHLGYSWWSNCALKRITYWENDPFCANSHSESVLLEFSDGKYYDMIRCCESVGYFGGEAVYRGCIRGVSYTVRVNFQPTLSYKNVCISLKASRPLNVRVGYRLVPVMGAKSDYPSYMRLEKQGDAVVFRRMLRESEFNACGFVCSHGSGQMCDPVLYQDSGIALFRSLFLEGESESKVSYSLGAFHSNQQFLLIREDAQQYDKQRALDFVKHVLTPKNTTGKANSFFPFWLSYQTVFGRSLSKTGFYQSGGAIGFRDQLQDSLIYLSFSPKVTRMMLIRCAAHQFEEGDVLHWWHNCGPSPHRGVRTCCSDDYLWLIWVFCEYVKATKDFDLLKQRAPFLKGKPLGDQTECYDAYEFTREKYPFLEHIRRMISLFFRRGLGRHGLPYMGSGDWNDGMNLVGRKGGESVWLGMFSILVFSALCDLGILEDEENERLRRYCSEEAAALDACFNGSWYLRAWFGNSVSLGDDISLNEECSIDLLPQAFSVFLYEFVPSYRTELRKMQMLRACEHVYRILFCERERVVRLFAPSFRFHEPNPGYIRSYADGVRENGGQYTHAAVWYCWALYFLSKHVPDQKEELKHKLMRVLDAICPDRTAGNEEKSKRYKNEPYVLSGDVYWTSRAKGRGGWSWYTGSAGWLYRLLERIEEDNKEDQASHPYGAQS